MKKPRQCPKCGLKKVATIQYGMPIPSAKLEADLAAGKIVLGGCCISNHDPRWRCLECGAEIYEDGTVGQYQQLDDFAEPPKE